MFFFNRYLFLICVGTIILFRGQNLLASSETNANLAFAASILAEVQEHYNGKNKFSSCVPQPYGEGMPAYVELIKRMTKKDIKEVDFLSKPYRIMLEFRVLSDSDVRLGLDVFLEEGHCKSFRLSEGYH